MERPLWLILVLLVGLHTLYAWAIPLGEGPDEPGHLAYVLFLTETGRLPVQRAEPEASDVPGEGHQPPLAYLLATPAVAWLPPEERRILLTANPWFVWAGGDEPGAFQRGSRERWPWQGLTLAWHLARAISGLWGALTVALTYLAARRLSPDSPWLAPLATTLVALNPQFLFSTALVSNDALLAALGAALLWWCLRPEPGRPGDGETGSREVGLNVWLHWAVVAGILFGLALLTKQSALLLGPLLLWGGWRLTGGALRSFVAVTLTWGLTTLLVAGWWFGRNWLLYGDPFGLSVFKAEFTTQPFDWTDPAAWGGALRQLFGSFWAHFGWMSLRPPAWVFWFYGGVCALAALGWLLAWLRPKDAKRTPLIWSPWIGPGIALSMALAWTISFALTAGLVAWQGRMLFPAIGAIGLLLAGGLLPLNRPRATGVLFCMLHAACCILMPLAIIRPAYPWVALAPQVAQAHLGNPVYARYAASWEQGVALRGWRLEAAAQPGISLPVTLTWNSLEPVPRPWTVFVHLVDPSETIVAKSNSQPRGGALPFTLWTPGDWMTDTHVLTLPTSLPPGTYRLRVGLYRPEKDGRRQAVWAADGSTMGDYAEVGAVVIQ